MKSLHRFVSFSVSALALCMVMPCMAQSGDGKVAIHVTPKQAYVFVDGRAISEASKHHSLSLSAGDHKIVLANYGYTPETRNVTVTAGKTTDLDVTLQPVSSTVAGPFGAMTIEGAAHDAVLLNGKTPDFFVGNGDEFDHDWDGNRNWSFPRAPIKSRFSVETRKSGRVPSMLRPTNVS